MRYPFLGIGHYELNNFPGCNQIVISNHSCIFPEHRGKGYGSELAEEKINRATKEGYDYMIATVVSTNTAQLRIMENNNWTRLDSFFNRESGNEVIIFGRRLSE